MGSILNYLNYVKAFVNIYNYEKITHFFALFSSFKKT